MTTQLCRTELHEAAFCGRALQLRSLLAGVSCNLGHTKDFSKHFFKYFQGANVNAKTEDHDTPLHDACLAGKWLCVKELIRKGANVSTFFCCTYV